ncbi:MAG: proline dehydrogenase [Chloroflexi bacterium]|nr:proline dehydrogenase [Chloroflexota bacterium]
MLRQTLLVLSHSKSLQRLVSEFSPARRLARRFVAGEQQEEALRVIQQLNKSGALVTLDYLGEHVTEERRARAYVAEYKALLAEIAQQNLQSGVSLKLSAMGLHIDPEFCYQNVCEVVAVAREQQRFVRIDIEESELVDITLEIYRRLRETFSNVGIALQAYLFRTRDDLQALLDEGIADVRLVKGAYDEPDDIAWQARGDIQNSLIELSQALLSPAAVAAGARLALGSHDDVVYKAVIAFAHAQGIDPQCWEIQFLYGIRRDELERLLQAGHRLRVYVPYGALWYPYFVRRLAERPANLLFFLRALAGA